MKYVETNDVVKVFSTHWFAWRADRAAQKLNDERGDPPTVTYRVHKKKRFCWQVVAYQNRATP